MARTKLNVDGAMVAAVTVAKSFDELEKAVFNNNKIEMEVN